MRQGIGDLPVQRRVAAAGLAQIHVAQGGLALQGFVEDLLDACPSIHGQVSPRPLSSRRSHARAKFQSRMTVFGATPNTSAVSSTLKPPKKRISKTRLLRSSVLARRSNARSTDTISSSCSGREYDGDIDGDMNRIASAFHAASRASVIHQDVAHHAGSHGEEVRTVAPAGIRARQEAQKRLLNQRGRLHRMVPTLMTEVATRKPTQFRINERRRTVILPIALAPIGQQSRDVVCLHRSQNAAPLPARA